MRSSFSTSPTEVILSETSDTEGDKSAPSPSEGESSHKGGGAKRDTDFPRCIRRTDRKPFAQAISSKRVEPVELPHCSSHKSDKAGQSEQDEEVLVFKIDEDRPFVRSKHRGRTDFTQQNISYRSLASQIEAS